MSSKPAHPMQVDVRPILREITGMSGQNNLVEQIIPAVSLINVASFRPGLRSNAPQFTFAPRTTGRLGIFAARKGDAERAAILLLPREGVPDRVLIGIIHRFGQSPQYYTPLDGANPLSPKLIQDVLLRFVVNRWGAQTLAGKKKMALMLIVRCLRKNELGPFAADGPFVEQVLASMVSLTRNAFSCRHVEAFTYSNGIHDMNVFLPAIASTLSLETVYSLDPAPALQVAAPASAVRKQFLSGQTFLGPLPPGFEYMPLNRWKHEDDYSRARSFGHFPFDYLHNHCVPNYILHLGIQLS